MKPAILLIFAFAFLIAAGNPGQMPGPGVQVAGFPAGLPAVVSPFSHIVVVIQENRSVDNLFQFLPGANTQSYGLNSTGGQVTLTANPLTQSTASPPVNKNYDLDHSHAGFVTECNNGTTLATCPQNGFNNEVCEASTATCPPGTSAAYVYVPQAEVSPYYTIAEQYAFADYAFQSNQGPSFPAHQYAVRGTSQVSPGSNYNAGDNSGGFGCDAASTLSTTINLLTASPGPSATPCYSGTSIFQELDTANVSWKYYQSGSGAGLWLAPDAIASLCPTTPCSGNAEFAAKVVTTPSQVLTDIANCALAGVVFVTPTSLNSDHPGQTDASGPAWVASIVDAIGDATTCDSGGYWNDTAIIINWDDWGGFYDHVPPPMYNYYEGGFRVPLIAVAAYAKQGVVVHTQLDSNGSTLRLIEETFNLPSLGAVDARSADLSDMFNFRAPPNGFTFIVGALPHSYWVAHNDTRPVDY